MFEYSLYAGYITWIADSEQQNPGAFATIHGANPRNPMLTYGPRPPCTPLLPEQTTTRRYLIFIYVYMYFLNMSLFTQIAALYAHIS